MTTTLSYETPKYGAQAFCLPNSEPKAAEYRPHTATAPPTMLPRVTGRRLAMRNWGQDTPAPSAIPRGIRNLESIWVFQVSSVGIREFQQSSSRSYK